jgi:hypothetical protein
VVAPEFDPAIPGGSVEFHDDIVSTGLSVRFTNRWDGADHPAVIRQPDRHRHDVFSGALEGSVAFLAFQTEPNVSPPSSTTLGLAC